MVVLDRKEDGMNPIFGFNRGLDYSYLYGSGTVKATASASAISFPEFLSLRTETGIRPSLLYYDKKKVIEGIKPSEFPKAKYKSLSNVKSFSKALENTALSLGETDFKDKKASLRAVKSFITSYNNLIESSVNTEQASILRREVFLTGRTATYASLLEEVGIKIEKNNTLTVNEEAYLKVEEAKLEEVFRGRLGFASRVGKQAGIISGIAENKMNSINKTYNRLGKFYGFHYATRIYEAV